MASISSAISTFATSSCKTYIFQIMLSDEIYDVYVIVDQNISITATGRFNKISYSKKENYRRSTFLELLEKETHTFTGEITIDQKFRLRYKCESLDCRIILDKSELAIIPIKNASPIKFEITVDNEVYTIEVILHENKNMAVTATGNINNIKYGTMDFHRTEFLKMVETDVHQITGRIMDTTFRLQYGKDGYIDLIQYIPYSKFGLMVNNEPYEIEVIIDDEFISVTATGSITKKNYHSKEKKTFRPAFMKKLLNKSYLFYGIIEGPEFFIEYHPDVIVLEEIISSVSTHKFELAVDDEIYDITVILDGHGKMSIKSAGRNNKKRYGNMNLDENDCSYFMGILKKDISKFKATIGNGFAITYKDTKDRFISTMVLSELSPIIPDQNQPQADQKYSTSLESDDDFFDIDINLVNDDIKIILTNKVTKTQYRQTNIMNSNYYKLITAALDKTYNNITYTFNKDLEYPNIKIYWEITDPFKHIVYNEICFVSLAQTDNDKMKLMMADLKEYLMKAREQKLKP